MLSPTTWTTLPWKRSPELWATSWRWALRSSIRAVPVLSRAHVHDERPQRVAELSQLGFELGVNLAVGCFDDCAARLHALVLLQLDAVGADAGRHYLRPAAAQELLVGRVDAHTDGCPCIHLFQRGADDVDGHVGHVLNLALDHLAGDLQGKIHHLAFGRAEERCMVLVDATHQRRQLLE